MSVRVAGINNELVVRKFTLPYMSIRADTSYLSGLNGIKLWFFGRLVANTRIDYIDQVKHLNAYQICN